MIELSLLKSASLSEAQSRAIAIESQSEPIGRLVPVGRWILDDDETIREFAAWRQVALRMFLTQSTPTRQSSYDYLEKLSIGDQSRMLFMIEDSTGTFVGHLGLANYSQDEAELDNLIRGRRGGPPELVLEAERALIRWAFSDLWVKRIYLRVLSHNFLAINLPDQLGFCTIEQLSLSRKTEDGFPILQECRADESNVAFKLNLMELQGEAFLAQDDRNH
jgi:RimJ/RimL family protein N-acetyltransferase